VVAHADVVTWVEGYIGAWRTAGVAGLRDLFTDDAHYTVSPWKAPIVGLAAIGRFWEAGRDGPDEAFEIHHELVAVDGDSAVVRVAVDYADRACWRDLWVIRFDAAGRCTAFEEWPFAPDQPDGQ
jgi:hypothetical protein